MPLKGDTKYVDGRLMVYVPGGGGEGSTWEDASQYPPGYAEMLRSQRGSASERAQGNYPRTTDSNAGPAYDLNIPWGKLAGAGAATDPNGSAQDFLSRGIDVSGLTQDQLEQRFPFASDPTFAAKNLIGQMGFNTNMASPLTGFIQKRAGDVGLMSQLSRSIAGDDATERPVIGDISSILGSGAGLSDPAHWGGGVIKGMADIEAQRGAGTQLKDSQMGALNKFVRGDYSMGDYDLQSMGNVFNVAQQGRLAPILRSKGLTDSILGDRYDDYRNSLASNPNKGFWNFISSRM